MIIYSYYALDIIHVGHLFHMERAKKMHKDCTHIVGILSDEAIIIKKGKPPIMPLAERLLIAKSIKFNDIVVVQNNYSPFDNLIYFQVDTLLESDSHCSSDIISLRQKLKEYDSKTKILIDPYFPSRSSTNIKEEIWKQK
jgi:glycerol-3-phosphate cytidylyltransferase